MIEVIVNLNKISDDGLTLNNSVIDWLIYNIDTEEDRAWNYKRGYGKDDNKLIFTFNERFRKEAMIFKIKYGS